MIRLIGMVLIWGGCALLGVKEARAVRGQVRLLEDMGRALEVLERELTLNRTAVPELLERLTRGQPGESGAVFFACRSMMEAGNGFADAWTCALEHSGLKREEQILLSGLSQVLGRYDADGQAQALAHLRQEVEHRSKYRREEAGALGRVYGMLGITVGGFLSLTLL